MTAECPADQGQTFSRSGSEPGTALGEEDFERLALVGDPFTEAQGELNGLLTLSDAFAAWEELDAMLSHLRFLESGQARISGQRVTQVGDSAMSARVPHPANWLIDPDLGWSYFDRWDQAGAWLRVSNDNFPAT